MAGSQAWALSCANVPLCCCLLVLSLCTITLTPRVRSSKRTPCNSHASPRDGHHLCKLMYRTPSTNRSSASVPIQHMLPSASVTNADPASLASSCQKGALGAFMKYAKLAASCPCCLAAWAARSTAAAAGTRRTAATAGARRACCACCAVLEGAAHRHFLRLGVLARRLVVQEMQQALLRAGRQVEVWRARPRAGGQVAAWRSLTARCTVALPCMRQPHIHPAAPLPRHAPQHLAPCPTRSPSGAGRGSAGMLPAPFACKRTTQGIGARFWCRHGVGMALAHDPHAPVQHSCAAGRPPHLNSCRSQAGVPHSSVRGSSSLL